MNIGENPAGAFHKKESIALISILFVYLLIFIIMPARGFWIVDNGNKYIQMKALGQNRFASAAIPWPGEKDDPHYTFNPLPNPFSVVKDNRLYSIFPPFFPALSYPFFSIFGLKGIYIIPLLSGLAILMGICKICQLLKFSENQRLTALLVSAFATPLLFYSFSFWEHTLAVALVIWSIFKAMIYLRDGGQKNLVLSFVLAALAVYFRDELLGFALVLAWVILYSRKQDRAKTSAIMAITFGLSIMPLLLGQYLLSGMPLGAHLSKHLTVAKGLLAHLADRPQVFYNLFLAMISPKAISSILILAYLITIFGHLFLAKRWQPWIENVTIVILIIHSLLMIILLLDDRVLIKLIDSNSVFAASPFLFLLLLLHRRPENSPAPPPGMPFIIRITVGFALFYLTAAPQAGSTGIHWGCRFLLLLYPLLTILWVHRYRSRVQPILTLKNLGLIIALVLAICLQVASVYLLYEKKFFNSTLNQFLARQPERIVITNIWHAPQDLSFNFDTKVMFYFKGRGQASGINRLLRQLKQRGERSVLYISPPGPFIGENSGARFTFRDSPIYQFQIRSLQL